MEKFYTEKNPMIITWEISQFSYFSNSNLSSDKFSIGKSLFFYLKYADDVFNLVCYKTRTNLVLDFCYSFQIKCYNGEHLKLEKSVIGIVKDTHQECCRSSLNRSHLFENKNKYLPGDCLSIQLILWNFPRASNLKQIMLRTKLEETKCIELNLNHTRLNLLQECVIAFLGSEVYEILFDFSNADKIKITCSKVKVDKEDENKYLNCIINIISSEGFKRKLQFEKTEFDKKNVRYTFVSSFIKNQYADFLTDDILRVQCEIAIPTSIAFDAITYMYEELQTKTVEKDESDLNMLENNFSHMYTSQKMKDVIFQIGNKTIGSHKFILAAQSPVFEAMFEHDMIEKKSNIIKIEDMTYDTLDEMLMFMYGGQLQGLNCERAIQLMYAAEKYQITSLKEKCSSYLRSNISIQNTCQVLIIADVVHDDALKATAVAFIKSLAKEILLSDEWTDLVKSHPQLAVETLTACVLEKLDI